MQTHNAFPKGVRRLWKQNTSWVNLILSHFEEGQKFILVADPDGILTEESVLTALRQQGYEMLDYEDPMVARYLYEKEWRLGLSSEAYRNQSLRTNGKLLLRSSKPDVQIFPYDWQQVFGWESRGFLKEKGDKQAQTVSLKLADLFPYLSYPVLSRMPHSYIPFLLAPAKRLRQPQGDIDTRRFVLKYALEFAPEAIVSLSGLIHNLILLYVRHPSIPQELLDTAASDTAWLNYPPVLFAGKNRFFNYLQQEWDSYVKSGNPSIPFEDIAVRYLMPNLFSEGFLRRSRVSRAYHSWISVGVVSDEPSTPERVITQLKEIQGLLPQQKARHTEWQAFVIRWGEVTAQVIGSPPSAEIDKRFFELREIINTHFCNWLQQYYSLLLSLSPLPTPVTVHKVAPYMASQSDEKRALIVADGLSMAAWWFIREGWNRQNVAFEWTESATFAVIPTITSISRQSIFAGKLPRAFPKHLNSTSHEANYWTRFWENQPEAAYDKGKLSDVLQRLEETTSNRTAPIVGLVINDIDDIADAEVQGLRGLAASLRHWIDTQHLEMLIHVLLQADYSVVLTSDHGHTSAKGIGTLKEGLAVESTCRRARLYASEALRPEHPNAHPWSGYGLPNELFPLLSAGYTAFATEGKEVVTHGGASVEEVLVPFIVFQQGTKEKSGKRSD